MYKRQIINIKTKSLTSGQANSMRLSSSDQMEVAYLDRRKAEYLYRESNGDFVFMDSETYDQFNLTEEFCGDKMRFCKDNTTVEVTFHESTPVGVELPQVVELLITEAEAAVKGNTATNVKKNAVVETGAEIKVPLHIVAGELVRVSTETGEFMGRAKE